MLVPKSSLIGLSILLLLGSCSTSKKTTETGKTATTKKTIPADCSNAGKAATELKWTGVARPSAVEAGNKLLPDQFESFTIDNNQLKAFFAAARQQGQVTIVTIPIPALIGCQEFEVRNSSAMPQELADKYPEIASLQGIGTVNRAGDLRMDYDGSRLHAQVIWNGQIFLITPLDYGNKTVYMIYDRAGTKEQKQPFEHTNDYRNTNSGNTAPSMQQYDR